VGGKAVLAMAPDNRSEILDKERVSRAVWWKRILYYLFRIDVGGVVIIPKLEDQIVPFIRQRSYGLNKEADLNGKIQR
jgi:hypothetical protein